MHVFMRHLFLLCGLCLFLTACNKDDDNSGFSQPEEGGIGEYFLLQNSVHVPIQPTAKPIFIDGGEMGFLECAYNTIRYPAVAKEEGVEGTVLIEFLIDVDGRVTEVVIVEDIGAGCGEAARVAIENCVLGRTFLPGELMGEATPMVWRIPVKFKLE